MTTLLAIDTATGPCSAAVWHAGRIVAYDEQAQPVMQSARLLPMIESILARSGFGYRDLSAIAVTVGPGSFTGIRVALAAARGICFASGIPGLGFTTLETLAFAARPYAAQAQAILSVIHAGKGEYYYQAFQHSPWQALSEPGLGTLEAAAAMAQSFSAITAGNAAIHGVAAAPVTFPRADALAELAARHSPPGQMQLRPFYIRQPDAKLPEKKVL